MSSEQAASMIEQLHSTCQAPARLQQELANLVSTYRQLHQETLQQALTNTQNTHDIAQQLRANQQVGPVEIQGTFHQISNISIQIHDDCRMDPKRWITCSITQPH